MKGRPLPPGGTIGVAAASSPFEERSEIDRSVRWYEERGYRVKLADRVYARDDFVAGDAAARARDVNQLFADPEVDVVQLLRGGYGASQVVPHIDFDTIAPGSTDRRDRRERHIVRGRGRVPGAPLQGYDLAAAGIEPGVGWSPETVAMLSSRASARDLLQ